MDHLDFVAPVHVGDLLILKASVNRAFRTSMEVGVRAMVEDMRDGDDAACVVGVPDVCGGGCRGEEPGGAVRDSGDGAPEAAV